MPSLSSDRLRAWRLFFESALTLIDVLEDDFERGAGIPVRWYDVLVHLEEAPEGLRMHELAEQILYSKSGLTRVIDRMHAEGLIQRHRPDDDRRSVFVLQTEKGRETMFRTRHLHHRWIAEHFSEVLSDGDIKALIRAFEKLSARARPLRPGRISG